MTSFSQLFILTSSSIQCCALVPGSTGIKFPIVANAHTSDVTIKMFFINRKMFLQNAAVLTGGSILPTSGAFLQNLNDNGIDCKNQAQKRFIYISKK